MGFFSSFFHDIEHPLSTGEKIYHAVKHVVLEAIKHPVEAVEVAAAPYTGGASLLLVAPTEEILHHKKSKWADLATAAGGMAIAHDAAVHKAAAPLSATASAASATAIVAKSGIFARLSADVASTSKAVQSFVAPVTGALNSVTKLARQINDNLVEPIVGPIETALRTYQKLKTEYHDDLSEGLRGLVKIPGQIAGALTNVDAVLARSNQQLGEKQEHTAESILAPAMQYAGAVPTVASVYHQAYTRMLLAPVSADYPPVDITGPAELDDLKAMLNTAENFILHPQKLKREFIDRNNALLEHYRAANKDVDSEFFNEVSADLSEAGDEMIPLISRSEERRVGKECRSRWSPYH